MLENNTIETASTEVTSIQRRNNVEKSKWKTHRYFVDFESRIHVEISTSNLCHNFHVDSPFKIYVISPNFPRRITTSNRWQIDEDLSIGFKTLLHIYDKALNIFMAIIIFTNYNYFRKACRVEINIFR